MLMEDVNSFAKALLHKTAQRIPLRSTTNPAFYDLRQLDYQLRKEAPSPDRLSARNVLKDFYARHMLGPKAKETLTESIPLLHRRSDLSPDSPISPAKSLLHPYPVPCIVLHRSSKSPLLRSKSAQRLWELDGLKQLCGYASETLDRERERMKEVKGTFVRRIRGCGERLREMEKAELKGSVPKALLEHKKKMAETRSKSTARLKVAPADNPDQQVIREYRKAVFSKASRSKLSRHMRYVYTLGSTSAKDLPRACA